MILVTGASGFLGRHLVRRLSSQGTPVRALYLHTPPDEAMLALPGVQWLCCDLLDIYAVEEVMEGVSAVYHCAAIVSFSAAGREQLQQVNINSTAHVVNEALERGGIRVLFVSSIATLGRAREGALLNEEDQWEESRNNTAYSRSKYLAEMEVWRAVAEGLDAVIVNPAIILGPGNWDKGSAALVKVADKEFPFYTEGINGWVDVQDVVTAMVLLMDSGISAERYIISGGNYSYRTIFSKMAAGLQRRPPRLAAGKWLTGLLWRLNALYTFFGGRKQVITRETGRTAQLQCSYDNGKLLRQFPSFRYTGIDDTISAMTAAFRRETA